MKTTYVAVLFNIDFLGLFSNKSISISLSDKSSFQQPTQMTVKFLMIMRHEG